MIDAGYSITEMKLILKSSLKPDLKLATWSSKLILIRFHSSERLGSTAQDAVYLLNASPQFPQMHRGELSKEYLH